MQSHRQSRRVIELRRRLDRRPGDLFDVVEAVIRAVQRAQRVIRPGPEGPVFIIFVYRAEAVDAENPVRVGDEHVHVRGFVWRLLVVARRQKVIGLEGLVEFAPGLEDLLHAIERVMLAARKVAFDDVTVRRRTGDADVAVADLNDLRFGGQVLGALLCAAPTDQSVGRDAGATVLFNNYYCRHRLFPRYIKLSPKRRISRSSSCDRSWGSLSSIWRSRLRLRV